jgi:hypothetical protein
LSLSRENPVSKFALSNGSTCAAYDEEHAEFDPNALREHEEVTKVGLRPYLKRLYSRVFHAALTLFQTLFIRYKFANPVCP